MLVKIMKLYNLTCDGHSFISMKKPIAFPDSFYSLVKVCYYDKKNKYNKNNNKKNCVEYIEGTFYLNGKKDRFKITGLDMNSMKEFPKELSSYIQTLSDEDKNSIIDNTEIIDFCNEDKSNILTKLFIIGMSSVLFYYYLMSTRSKNLFGFSIFSSTDNTTDNTTDNITCLLDQNTYKYIKHMADMLMITNDKRKPWMNQIVNFWNVWGSLFPKELSLNYDEIMYKSILAYGKYFYSEISNLTRCYETSQKNITRTCETLKTDSEKFITMMDNMNRGFKKKFKHASLLITIITSIVLKTIGSETTVSLKEYNDKSKLILNQQLDRLKKEVPNIVTEVSEKVRTDVSKNINKNINKNISKKINQTVSDKIKKIETQMEDMKEEIAYLKGLVINNENE